MIIAAAQAVNRRFVAFACCLCVVLLQERVGVGQQLADLDQRTTQSLAQFDHPSWRVRGEGFYSLLSFPVTGSPLVRRTSVIPLALNDLFSGHARRREQVSLALIQLLAKENAAQQNPRAG